MFKCTISHLKYLFFGVRVRVRVCVGMFPALLIMQHNKKKKHLKVEYNTIGEIVNPHYTWQT